MEQGLIDELYFRKFRYGSGGGGGGGDKYTTFTGSLIQFTAPKAHAFKSFSFTVDPVQDLHGQSAPYPAGGGKNKVGVLTAGTYNGVTITDNGDGSYTLNGTATANTTVAFGKFIELPAGTYTMQLKNPETGVGRIQPKYGTSAITTALSFTTANKVGVFTASNGITGVELFFQSGSSYTNYKFAPQLEAGSTSTSFAPPENICPISGWNSANLYRTAEYDPTASPSLTLNFPSTVYGGNAVWNGDGTWTVTVDRAKATFSGQEQWVEYPSYNGFTAYPSGQKKGMRQDGVCNWLRKDIGTHNPCGFWIGVNNVAFYAIEVSNLLSEYSVDAWKAYLAQNPLEVVYPLATPQTITVTTETLFNALKGENNIWTDTGDTTLEAIGEAIELNALQSLNILLGGRYVNNHTADDVSDEEALNILLGGNDR